MPECWDGSVSQWVPLKGCAWLAGAREAQNQIADVGPALRQRVAGALTLDNIFEVGSAVFGMALGPLGPVATEAALTAGSWSADQAVKLLGMVERLANDTAQEKKKVDSIVANLPPKEREAALTSLRGRIGDRGAQLALQIAKLAKAAEAASGDLKGAIERTRKSLTSTGYGVVDPLTAAVVLAVSAVILALLWVIHRNLREFWQDLVQRRCLKQADDMKITDPDKRLAFLEKCMTTLGKAKEDPYKWPMIIGGTAAALGAAGYLVSQVRRANAPG